MTKVQSMSEAVEPKVGMPVEHGRGADRNPARVVVKEVDPANKTFKLGTKDGDNYSTTRPNKELIKVGEKVIWNHD